MSNYRKYPRTLHLDWSQHVTTDDKVMPVGTMNEIFRGREVIVSEKLDGECTTFYNDHIHARSTMSRDHPSRHWVKALHGSICHDIPEGWRICGENMFAEHSIHYMNLPTYFFVFAIFNEEHFCLPWDETQQIAEMLGLQTVPVLYRGTWDEQRIKGLFTDKSVFEGSYDVQTYKQSGDMVETQEGYVVRRADGFPSPTPRPGMREFFIHLAKFVRQGHVATDEHWLDGPVVQNELRERNQLPRVQAPRFVTKP